MKCTRCDGTAWVSAPGGVRPCPWCPRGQKIIEGRKRKLERKTRRRNAVAKPEPEIAPVRHFQDREELA